MKIFQTFIGPAGSDEEDLMSKLCCQPIQDNTLMTFLTKDPNRSNSNPMISLEMIIMMQKDEPNQKSCIYKMQTKRLVPDAQGKG